MAETYAELHFGVLA